MWKSFDQCFGADSKAAALVTAFAVAAPAVRCQKLLAEKSRPDCNADRIDDAERDHVNLCPIHLRRAVSDAPPFRPDSLLNGGRRCNEIVF